MPLQHRELEQFLVCPATKSPLVADEGSLVCSDPQCRLKFPIRDDIPIMLVEEAAAMPPDDWAALMRKHGRDPAAGTA